MSDERAKRLGKRIEAAMHARGWTQAELARRAYIGRSYVSHIKDGRNMPSVEVIDRIAQAFETTTEALLSDDESDLRTPEQLGAMVVQEAVKVIGGVPVHVRYRIPVDDDRDIEDENSARMGRPCISRDNS